MYACIVIDYLLARALGCRASKSMGLEEVQKYCNLMVRDDVVSLHLDNCFKMLHIVVTIALLIIIHSPYVKPLTDPHQ